MVGSGAQLPEALTALGPGRRRPPSFRRIVAQSFMRDPAALTGLVLVVVWLTLAIIGPTLASDPSRQALTEALRPPFWANGGTGEHLLGTDSLGRDILARILFGARTSLGIGVVTTILTAVIGSFVGAVAAEWGGLTEEAIMRVADIQLSIPFILLGITVLAIVGGSTQSLVLVLVLAGWVLFARVVRSELLHLREMEFVIAARSIGVGRLRIALRHMLPNAYGLIIILATFQLANVIILEAALSFLGVGVRPPEVSWGTMLADGRDYLTSAWWLATFPGVAITLTILGVNLLGDWARDVLDPRARS